MTHLRRCAVLSVLCLPVIAAAASWEVYVNDRFGTVVEVPGGLLPEAPPANADGRRWVLDDGGEIAVWGGYWDATVDSWAAYRAQRTRWARDGGLEVTYAPSGEDWFVISGTSDGDIVYMRAERSPGCPSVAHHVRLVYPQARKADWDPVVERAAQTLGEHKAVTCP